jgi:hypothetical protein
LGLLSRAVLTQAVAAVFVSSGDSIGDYTPETISEIAHNFFNAK